jgi:hypothetical protein
MASLILSAEIAAYQQAVNDHFDTFKRNITVHKSPVKKIISSMVNPQMIGYQENSIEEQIEYVAQNQNFDAIIAYKDPFDVDIIDQIKVKTTSSLVSIKVKKDARDYILSDKTEKITFDDKTFKVISNDIIKSYQGLLYYVFYIEEIK